MITATQVRQYQSNAMKDIDYIDTEIKKCMTNTNCVALMIRQNSLELVDVTTNILRDNGYNVKLFGDEYISIGWGKAL